MVILWKWHKTQNSILISTPCSTHRCRAYIIDRRADEDPQRKTIPLRFLAIRSAMMILPCSMTVAFISRHYESTQNKYYYVGHVYELPELKVLVDAIASSSSYPAKSEELITKLLTPDQFPECREAPSAYLCCGRVV